MRSIELDIPKAGLQGLIKLKGAKGIKKVANKTTFVEVQGGVPHGASRPSTGGVKRGAATHLGVAPPKKVMASISEKPDKKGLNMTLNFDESTSSLENVDAIIPGITDMAFPRSYEVVRELGSDASGKMLVAGAFRNLEMCVILRKQKDEAEKTIEEWKRKCEKTEKTLLESSSMEEKLKKDLQLSTAKVKSLELKLKKIECERDEALIDIERLREKSQSMLNDVASKVTLEIYNKIVSGNLSRENIEKELKDFHDVEGSKDEEEEEEEEKEEKMREENNKGAKKINDGGKRYGDGGGYHRSQKPRATPKPVVHSIDYYKKSFLKKRKSNLNLV